MSFVNTKISRSLFAIKQAKVFLPYASLRTLYFSLIHPYISYGILAWGNANQNVLHRTNILQKRALRIVHNKHYNSHTDPLFKQSGILKLNDLYKREVLLFMHDFIHAKLPVSFRDLFTFNRDVNVAYETRQSDLFHINRIKSKFVNILPLFSYPLL